MKLSVIIPVFNEKENLLPLFNENQKVLDELKKTKKISSYEIIFIDDGSIDGTAKILEELSLKNKTVKSILFRRNFGQTAALKAGFDYTRGDLIVTMDGDLQNDPKDIPMLIEKINQGYDVVSGWRVNRKDNFGKKIASKIMNIFRKKIVGDKLHDYGCSLKIYKKDCIKDLELFGELHRYITAYLHIKGYKIGEIPVNHHSRKFGKTKYKLNRGLNGIFDLFFLKFWSSYSSRPLHFFGRIGVFQWLLAFFILFEQIIKSVIVQKLSLGPLLMLAAVLGISGLLFIIFGFMSEMLSRNFFSNRKIYNIKKIYN